MFFQKLPEMVMLGHKYDLLVGTLELIIWLVPSPQSTVMVPDVVVTEKLDIIEPGVGKRAAAYIPINISRFKDITTSQQHKRCY